MKLFLFALITLGVAAPATAQDPLVAARELYASADYEQALEKLGDLRAAETAESVLEQVDQYRAFCLFALGRTADARAVAESLVKKNPMLELDATDASPRLSAMFTDVRRRLLPALVRDRYRQARAALDSKNFMSAEPQLIEVRRMINDAEEINVLDEGMADLRVLVDGFIDLTRSLRDNAAEQQARADAAAAEKLVKPVADTVRVVADSSQTGITPPVILRQDLPQVPKSLLPMFNSGVTAGQLDVLIDDLGNVEEATIRQSMHPVFDAIVMRAAKLWKYRPARNGTTPVKYMKTVAVIVQK